MAQNWRPKHDPDGDWCYCAVCEARWVQDYTKDLPKPAVPPGTWVKTARPEAKVERSLKS